MKSVVVIIVSFLIFSMVLLMTLSSNSDYEDKYHENVKNSASKSKIIQLNDHPNHLFWFIQVFIM